MQRFLTFAPAAAADGSDDGSDDDDEEEDVGFALSGVAEGLFGSPSFVKFVQAITGCTLTHSRHAVRRFRPGLDYTVAHFGAISSDETLDMSLCFIGGGDSAWDDGELGGFECYMPADDASNARASAEVYTAEGDGVLSLSAAFNSLNLVKRGANLDMKAKGKTALHYAVLNVHPNCAKPLLDAGARTDIRVDVDDSDFTEADGMTAMEIVEDKLLVAREPISHQLRLLKKMLRQAEAGLPVDSFLKEEVSEDLKHFGGARACVYNWGL